MKERVVIHKIKALYEEGNGLLGISRNRVKKYLRMEEVVQLSS